jgi:hypothetical protein
MQTRPDDDVFHALADRRRRSVIRYLATETDGTATVREVADHVSSRRDERSAATLVALRHTILPTLAEAGLLQYDPDRGRIRYLPSESAEDLLSVVDDG